jgi:transposase InsO family protein
VRSRPFCRRVKVQPGCLTQRGSKPGTSLTAASRPSRPFPNAVRCIDYKGREVGLPARIRSDGGSPFASTGAGGLTRLAVWWVELGTVPGRIRPGKPQENGRLERFHGTLERE